MSNTLNKIIALIAVFCYLSASSIASAHVGSSMSDSNDLTEISSMLVNNQGKDGDPNSMPPSCHNQDSTTDGQANFACELLCSAIGHVMLDFEEPIINDSAPELETASLLADLITRQLLVEKRPPK